MKEKSFQIWIDGRIFGTIKAENAIRALDQAEERWPEEFKKAKDIEIVRN
jgi:hypothetical protein